MPWTLVPGPSLPAGEWDCLRVHPSGSPMVVGDGQGKLASFVDGNASRDPTGKGPDMLRYVLRIGLTRSPSRLVCRARSFLAEL